MTFGTCFWVMFLPYLIRIIYDVDYRKDRLENMPTKYQKNLIKCCMVSLKLRCLHCHLFAVCLGHLNHAQSYFCQRFNLLPQTRTQLKCFHCVDAPIIDEYLILAKWHEISETRSKFVYAWDLILAMFTSLHRNKAISLNSVIIRSLVITFRPLVRIQH